MPKVGQFRSLEPRRWNVAGGLAFRVFAVQRLDCGRVVAVGAQVCLGLLQSVRIVVADALELLQRCFGVVDGFAFTIVDVLPEPIDVVFKFADVVIIVGLGKEVFVLA
jgi:hypothetical protein